MEESNVTKECNAGKEEQSLEDKVYELEEEIENLKEENERIKGRFMRGIKDFYDKIVQRWPEDDPRCEFTGFDFNPELSDKSIIENECNYYMSLDIDDDSVDLFEDMEAKVKQDSMNDVDSFARAEEDFLPADMYLQREFETCKNTLVLMSYLFSSVLRLSNAGKDKEALHFLKKLSKRIENAFDRIDYNGIHSDIEEYVTRLGNKICSFSECDYEGNMSKSLGFYDFIKENCPVGDEDDDDEDSGVTPEVEAINALKRLNDIIVTRAMAVNSLANSMPPAELMKLSRSMYEATENDLKYIGERLKECENKEYKKIPSRELDSIHVMHSIKDNITNASLGLKNFDSIKEIPQEYVEDIESRLKAIDRELDYIGTKVTVRNFCGEIMKSLDNQDKGPELALCPICKSKAALESMESLSIVKCTSCGCNSGIYNTPEDAVNAWNKRRKRRRIKK